MHKLIKVMYRQRDAQGLLLQNPKEWFLNFFPPVVVEYPHIFPKVVEYPKMTPIVAEYPCGYSATIGPLTFLCFLMNPVLKSPIKGIK